MSAGDAIVQELEGLQMSDATSGAGQEIAEFILRLETTRLKRLRSEGVDMATLKVKFKLVMAALRVLVGSQHADEATRVVSIALRNETNRIDPNNNELDNPAEIDPRYLHARFLRVLGDTMIELQPVVASGSQFPPHVVAQLVGKGVAMRTLYEEASLVVGFAKLHCREMVKEMPEEQKETTAWASDLAFDLIHTGMQSLEAGLSIIDYARALHASDQSTDEVKEWAAMVGLFDGDNQWPMDESAEEATFSPMHRDD